MINSLITKTLKRLEEQPKEYSLGSKRFYALPKKVRKQINLYRLIRRESNNDSIKELFNNMTEKEYINWLKNY